MFPNKGDAMISRLSVLVLIALPCPALLADRVQLSNGDSVSGTLIEVTGGHVVIDSPLLGNVRLLRADVRAVRFGTKEQIEADIQKENAALIKAATQKVMAARVGAETKPAVPVAGGVPNPIGGQPIAAPKANMNLGNQDIDGAMGHLNQMFPDAKAPEIQNHVRNQLGQILSGQKGLGDIRNQAADTSRQVRQMKGELQKMGAWNPMYDMYLGILDNFVERVDDGEGLE